MSTAQDDYTKLLNPEGFWEEINAIREEVDWESTMKKPLSRWSFGELYAYVIKTASPQEKVILASRCGVELADPT